MISAFRPQFGHLQSFALSPRAAPCVGRPQVHNGREGDLRCAPRRRLLCGQTCLWSNVGFQKRSSLPRTKSPRKLAWSAKPGQPQALPKMCNSNMPGLVFLQNANDQLGRAKDKGLNFEPCFYSNTFPLRSEQKEEILVIIELSSKTP